MATNFAAPRRAPRLRRVWRRCRVSVGLVVMAGSLQLPPFAAGGSAVAAPPKSEYFLYVKGFASDGVHGYAASDTTSPTPLQPEPWPSGLAGWPVAASPDGRFLYVGSGLLPGLRVYSIGSDGKLGLLPAMPILLPDDPVDFVFTRDGKYAFMTMGAVKATIQPYTFAPNGVPIPNGPTVPMGSAGDGLTSAAISPDGQNLYVASYFQNQIARFEIRADGTLAAKERVSTKDGPIYPNVSPDGRHLYVSNERGTNVSGYNIAPDGSLAEVVGSPFASGQLPHVSAFTPDGKYFYVPGGGVSGYAVQPDGRLRQLAGSPFSTADGDASSELCVVSPSGRVLWVYGASAGGDSQTVALRKFTIQPDGGLVAGDVIDTGTSFADGRGVALVPRPR